MSYDLYAWPVDRPMSADEARVEIGGRSGGWPFGLGHDKRLDPFVQAMERRFPGLGSPLARVPMEFDVNRNWVFIALPWSYVAGLIEAIAPIAFATGIALFDPQRDEVALPEPFGTEPLGTSGVAAHERLAEQAFDRIRHDDSRDPDGGPASGAGDVPPSLQPAEGKAELIAQLGDIHAAVQYQALATLSGWEPDPDVRAALRPLLESDDVHVVGQACTALARQGLKTDLAALLAAVHRMSPAEGGTLESMLVPLTAALDLAAVVGPEAVADVKASARVWRSTPTPAWRREAFVEAELDRILG